MVSGGMLTLFTSSDVLSLFLGQFFFEKYVRCRSKIDVSLCAWQSLFTTLIYPLMQAAELFNVSGGKNLRQPVLVILRTKSVCSS